MPNPCNSQDSNNHVLDTGVARDINPDKTQEKAGLYLHPDLLYPANKKYCLLTVPDAYDKVTRSVFPLVAKKGRVSTRMQGRKMRFRDISELSQ